MDKATTNQVRQILMNELGLTRESVREEMRNIVATEAKKAVDGMIADRTLERLVRNEFARLAGGRGYNRPSIERMISDAAAVEARKFVRENLKIEWPTPDRTDGPETPLT